MRRAVRSVSAALIAGLCLCACATLGVTSTTATATLGVMSAATTVRGPAPGSASRLAQAQATHEYPSPPPAAQTVAGGQTSPVHAIERFADTYINWDAQDVAGRLRALAAESVGQARSAMALAAAGAANDYELRQGGIANAGSVQAVAPLHNSTGRFVVVTLERTTAANTSAYDGLRPAWHLAIATVVRLAGDQWALSGWQPEN